MRTMGLSDSGRARFRSSRLLPRLVGRPAEKHFDHGSEKIDQASWAADIVDGTEGRKHDTLELRSV
jgi:hypothetical protein